MKTLTNKVIFEWDHLNWSKVLSFWLDNESFQGKTILAIGERNGGLSLLFASLGANIICSDFGGISDSVILNHKQFDFSENIHYTDIDIFNIPFDDCSFDYVVCKSVIGGLKLNYYDKSSRNLQNQKLAINEVLRVLKKGGKFLGVENMQGNLIMRYLKKMLNKNRGWRYLNIHELDFLFNNFDRKNYDYFGVFPGVFRFSQFNFLIYIFNYLLNRFIPPKLKYILFFKLVKSE